MQLDVLAALLVTAGMIVAIGLAILAGKLSARVFFDVSGHRHESRPARSRSRPRM